MARVTFDEVVDAEISRLVAERQAITDACDDSCVDRRCGWFFLHGKRTGIPSGLVTDAR